MCENVPMYQLLIGKKVVALISPYLTLPALGLFETSALSGVKMILHLKILDNEVKMLELVPNLGNHNNSSKIYQTKFSVQNF